VVDTCGVGALVRELAAEADDAASPAMARLRRLGTRQVVDRAAEVAGARLYTGVVLEDFLPGDGNGVALGGRPPRGAGAPVVVCASPEVAAEDAAAQGEEWMARAAAEAGAAGDAPLPTLVVLELQADLLDGILVADAPEDGWHGHAAPAWLDGLTVGDAPASGPLAGYTSPLYTLGTHGRALLTMSAGGGGGGDSCLNTLLTMTSAALPVGNVEGRACDATAPLTVLRDQAVSGRSMRTSAGAVAALQRILAQRRVALAARVPTMRRRARPGEDAAVGERVGAWTDAARTGLLWSSNAGGVGVPARGPRAWQAHEVGAAARDERVRAVPGNTVALGAVLRTKAARARNEVYVLTWEASFGVLCPRAVGDGRAARTRNVEAERLVRTFGGRDPILWCRPAPYMHGKEPVSLRQAGGQYKAWAVQPAGAAVVCRARCASAAALAAFPATEEVELLPLDEAGYARAFHEDAEPDDSAAAAAAAATAAAPAPAPARPRDEGARPAGARAGGGVPVACTNCGMAPVNYVCLACSRAAYCTAACQSSHMAVHVMTCGRL